MKSRRVRDDVPCVTCGRTTRATMKSKVSDSPAPKLIGRLPTGEFKRLVTDVRANTTRVTSCTSDFASGAVGAARVTIFKSEDSGDRAGFVVRIEVEDEAGEPFLPTAQLVENGVEVHVAGEAEARAVVHGLSWCLRDEE